DVRELLEELRAGRMIILVDDEDRENEGDLVFAAQFTTPEKINFLLSKARGELCLALDDALCDKLQLPLQTAQATNRFGTAFTVTIEAARGVTTGISVKDRATTILAAVHPDAVAADLVRPGHVHPLRARPGGVLVRPGQTEGSVDLCRMAGLRPAAVIMEILKEDGVPARRPELDRFAARHGLKMGTIADLVAYRRRHERLVTRMASVKLPTPHGDFDLHVYTSPYDHDSHLALTRGIPLPADGGPGEPIEDAVLGRVHSECLTGDVFHSRRCDCGAQLEAALARIAQEPRAFLLYMRQEGRGIGLLNKLKSYALQDSRGLDTVEANLALGFRPDERNYGTGSSILFDLGLRRIRLLTNNPSKRAALAGYGLEITDREPLSVGRNPDNERYLTTKQKKLGHLF
ncbi:MAG TPA: GTP cyclohydrolase II, partial [Planctomycetota bacterium]|nr:GTP cyclohydrolase II [Planctomycetota bacterium]